MSITIVLPKNVDSIDDLNIEKRPLKPFSKILIDFVDDVSKTILKDSLFKQYPELMALAFWMRRSHISRLENYFKEMKKDKVLLGRGVVFHMAPSNVDTIFVYSWFISLLVGNSNILRVSDKENIQTELLLNVISSVLYKDEYKLLQNRVSVIRYGHIDEVTQKLSLMADVRVIWGGDNTVKHIRTIPIKPTAMELTFADKFSFAIINSKEFLKNEKKDKLIQNFYNDAFWFGQMACSSIRLVIWIGEEDNNTKAKKQFWEQLNSFVSANIPDDIAPADIVNKLVAQHSMAIENNIQIKDIDNPYINIVKITNMNEIKEELHCGTGLFYELELDTIDKIVPCITKKHQTVAQYGFKKEELFDFIDKHMPEGIDRIVPIGKSLDFSYIWDGYDLFRSFCREIEVTS